MNSLKYLILLQILIFSFSCKVQGPENNKQGSTRDKEKRSEPNKLIGFSYKTTYTFSKILLLRNEENKPASNTLVTLFYTDLTDAKKVLVKFYTNQRGQLDLSVTIPIHVSKIKLQYKGLTSTIIQTVITRKRLVYRIIDNLLSIVFPVVMAQETPIEPVTQVSYFPSQCTFGTLGFEDLWPTHGDQDFNDLVVNYNFAQKIDTNNEITSMDITIQFVASGAGYKNGFAIELPIKKEKIKSVTGNLITGNYINLNDNGTEAGQENAVIIISDDVSLQIPNFTNVFEGRFGLPPFEFKVTIEFNKGVKVPDLSMPPYNPFLIVNKNRAREVHLPDYAPTKLADKKMFGEYHDDSVPEFGRYYKDKNNNPWAIHIPVSFSHMREKQKIQNGHKRFSSWAESKGQNYSDWYLGKQDYRNDYFIFKKTLPHIINPIITCEDEENTITVTIKDGAEAEESVDTIQSSEISINESGYEDSYSTAVYFEPFNNLNGKRELLYAKISYNLAPSFKLIGKNLGGLERGSVVVSSSQSASLDWAKGMLANDEFSRVTNISNIYPGTLDQYSDFLEKGSHHTRFPKRVYNEDFRGMISFSGDELSLFLGLDPISFTLKHSVRADLNSYVGNNVSVETNFRIKGSITIKYIWRQFGTSGVKFNDSKLENALRIKLGVWSGGITSEHCSGVEELDLSGYAISDLKGLEICSDLKSLNLKDNKLSNIDILSKLTLLKNLYLSKNSLSSLSSLQSLISLEILEFSENQIIDLSPLSNLVNLKRLIFHNNKVVDLTPLSKMINLSLLHADRNSIEKVKALTSFTKLSNIQLRFNKIDDGSPFGTLVNLKYLNLRSNKTKNINWVTELSLLYHLVISDNQITTLPNMEKLDRISRLYLDNNPISDLTNLTPVKDTMVSIFLSNTQLVNTSQLKDFPLLNTLHMNNSNIDINDLVSSPLLSNINFTNTTILNKEKFNKFPNLKYLNLHGSGVMDIDFLKDNGELIRLYLNHNDIIDLSSMKGKYPSLTHLYVGHNKNLSCSSINTLWYYKYRKVETSWNYEPVGCVITELDPLTEFSSIFSDFNLSYQVRKTIDKMSGDLLPIDIKSYSLLAANDKSVESIEGIQHWTSLTNLSLSNNLISDLTPLADLPVLIGLDLSNNPITSLPELKSKNVVEELNISDTQIKDIQGLLDMPNLTKVTMTGLSLSCDQLNYVNQLSERKISIEVSPFLNCDPLSFILEEESSASLIQHSSTDLSSSNINYSEQSEQVFDFSPFDNQGGTVELTETKVTISIDSSIGGLAKNFNSQASLNGSLEVSNKVMITNNSAVNLMLPGETSYLDLANSLSFINPFLEIPMSSVQEYQDFRSTGANQMNFKEVDIFGTKEIAVVFTGDDLVFFSSGNKLSLKVKMESSAIVKSGSDELLYDFDSKSDIKIKIDYKYRQK